MRTIVGALVLLAVAGSLTGCDVLAGGPLAATPATVDTASPVATATPGAPASPYVPGVTRTRILTEEDTRGLESTPWALVDVGDRSLLIRYVAGGGCSAWQGVRVRETARSVEIWTTVRTDHGPQACTSELDLGASRVTLQQPLGARTLLHAPVSDSWRLYLDDF